MIAKLIIAGDIRLKGEKTPVSGVLFEVDVNDSAALKSMQEFVRAHFGEVVEVSAKKVETAEAPRQGVGMSTRMTESRFEKLSPREQDAVFAAATRVGIYEDVDCCPRTGRTILRYMAQIRGIVVWSGRAPKGGWRKPERARRDGWRIIKECRRAVRGGAA